MKKKLIFTIIVLCFASSCQSGDVKAQGKNSPQKEISEKPLVGLPLPNEAARGERNYIEAFDVNKKSGEIVYVQRTDDSGPGAFIRNGIHFLRSKNSPIESTQEYFVNAKWIGNNKIGVVLFKFSRTIHHEIYFLDLKTRKRTLVFSAKPDDDLIRDFFYKPESQEIILQIQKGEPAEAIHLIIAYQLKTRQSRTLLKTSDGIYSVDDADDYLFISKLNEKKSKSQVVRLSRKTGNEKIIWENDDDHLDSLSVSPDKKWLAFSKESDHKLGLLNLSTLRQRDFEDNVDFSIKWLDNKTLLLGSDGIREINLDI